MNQTRRLTEKQADDALRASVGKYLNKPLSNRDYRLPVQGPSVSTILKAVTLGAVIVGLVLRFAL